MNFLYKYRLFVLLNKQYDIEIFFCELKLKINQIGMVKEK